MAVVKVYLLTNSPLRFGLYIMIHTYPRNILYIFHILAYEIKRRTNMDISILAAAIATTIGSAVTALVTAFFYRSVNEAKVKSIIADTYDELVKTLSEQIKVLQEDVVRLRARLDHLTVKEIQYLEQITALIKERNHLQILIAEKEQIIEDLRKKYLPGT